jgi:serine/threonine protein kinase
MMSNSTIAVHTARTLGIDESPTLPADPTATIPGTDMNEPSELARTLPRPKKFDSQAVDAGRARLLANMFGVAAESKDPIPELDGYEILGELGRGGMGVVHAARDIRLDRKVAIKQLSSRPVPAEQLDGGRSEHQRRLVREALAMAKLSHPNVVPIYQIGERGGSTFIVMEHVEGQTLRSWQQTARSHDEVLAVYKAAARGLIAAHQKQLVHRDFKPDNVMIGDDGRVRVMDFGLASVISQRVEQEGGFDVDASERSAPLTRTGTLLGTPAYMSPEQLETQPADAASDQFSFCVALYEALYGERPFAGGTLGALRLALTSGVIREPPAGSSVPEWLRELVCRGLAPKPEGRFGSMQALLDALVEGELGHEAQPREPPEYVFVHHDGSDKQAVVRLCESLLDHGVRPWLDIWELSESRPSPGKPVPSRADWAAEDARAQRDGALAEAPAVIVCSGQGSPTDAVLAARVDRDPASVRVVDLAALDEAHGTEAVLELARLVGIDHARDGWLEHEAARLGIAPEELSPYRGLEAFREQDARWMFGRDEEIAGLLELIRADQTRFLTLIGASGSGKSSLLMAGVCPMLRHGVLGDGIKWSIAHLRPGPRPCEALAHALVSLDIGADMIADKEQIERLRSELLAGQDALRLFMADRERGRVLLVIDQLEELFTEADLGATRESSEALPGEGLAFVQNLLEATQKLAGVDGKLWIAATLRADFVQRGLEIPELARALKIGTYFALPPMQEAQIRSAIERPAARVGYRVEGKLVDKLVAAAAHQAGRLPLLQHVLRELWARRDAQRRLLTDAAYAETGGLEGAIAVAAERALDDLRGQLGASGELATRRLMTRLVHLADRTAEDTRRRVELAELGEDATTRQVLEAFVRHARVLVAAEVDGIETVEIAHEALLREWKTLARWLDADREALKLRQELARDAVHRRSASTREYLWGRARVEEAQRVLAASVVELNDAEREFLAASERSSRRRRRWTRAVVAALLATAVVVVVVVSGKNTQLAQQKRESDQQRQAADVARTGAEQAEARAVDEQGRAQEQRSRAEQAKTQAEKSQKENERSVRQMFEVALRPLTEQLIERRESVGVVQVNRDWTPLLRRSEHVLVAASLGDSVRIVVAGHEAVLSEVDSEGRSLFLEITAQWLLADQARRKIAIVTQQPGDYRRLEVLERNLLRLSHRVEICSSLTADAALDEVGMLVLDNRWTPAFTAEELAAIEAFVRRGGGVLAVGIGRSWLDGGHGLDDYPMNAALAPFGARWSDALVSPEALEEREIEAIVRFESSLVVDVNLYTRSGEREEYYTTLAAGDALELLTEIGREWVVRSSVDGRQIDAVVIEDAEQTLRIGAGVAKTRSKPKSASPPTAAAQPDVAPGQLPNEVLSEDDMRAGKDEAKRAAKACGEQLRTLLSEATVRVKVDRDGKVTDVVMLPPAKGTQAAACIEEAVRKLSFARSRAGAEATWTLALY